MLSTAVKVLLLVLVCTVLVVCTADEASIGLLILDDPFMRKTYRNTFRRSINWAQRSYGYGSIKLKGKAKFLSNFLKNEVEKNTCKLVRGGTGCIIHMYTGYRWYDEYPEMEIVAMSAKLGFPIIMWNRDGFMPVVVCINIFYICLIIVRCIERIYFLYHYHMY